jgi:NADH-quinone oxidoreductase subunit J
MVLFLFVIMMLDVDLRERSRPNIMAASLGLVTTGAVVAILLTWAGEGSTIRPSVGSVPTPGNPLAFVTGSKAFGYALLTKYMLPIQVAGFLLLVAMVGAILLGRRTNLKSSEGKDDS